MSYFFVASAEARLNGSSVLNLRTRVPYSRTHPWEYSENFQTSLQRFVLISEASGAMLSKIFPEGVCVSSSLLIPVFWLTYVGFVS